MTNDLLIDWLMGQQTKRASEPQKPTKSFQRDGAVTFHLSQPSKEPDARVLNFSVKAEKLQHQIFVMDPEYPGRLE